MYEEYDQQFTTPNGKSLTVTLRTGTVDFNVINSVVTHDEYDFKNYSFKKGDVVIDIGSHIGGEALLLFAIEPNMMIYCFEPLPENVGLLRKNLLQNNFGNFKVFQLAVTDHLGKEKIYYAGQSTPADIENNFIGNAYGFSQGNPIDVDSITLEKIFQGNNIEHAKMVRMDCEGLEYRILRACPAEILSKIDWIIGEHHQVRRLDLLAATKGLFEDVPCRYQSDTGFGHFKFKNKKL